MNFLAIPFIRRALSVRMRCCTWKRNKRWRGGGRYLSTCGSHFFCSFECRLRGSANGHVIFTWSAKPSISKRAALAWKAEKGKVRKRGSGTRSCKCSPMESRNAIRAASSSAASPITNRVFLLLCVIVHIFSEIGQNDLWNMLKWCPTLLLKSLEYIEMSKEMLIFG